jgi:carboxynorspermidine decarboxylase
LCEQGSDALIATLGSVEAHFGRHLEKCEWVNFGGGHHITRDGYDVESLVKCVSSFRDRYGAEVYLEPGEAVALDSGYLVSSVLDVVRNGMDIAILDASAACHMPDVLEMPYRPNVIGASLVGDAPFAYRLAGSTCLAGDIVGDYAFREPLRAGDLLAFEDMAIYSMVKTNTFNGMRLPSIAVLGEDGNARMVKGFSYEDFKARLS